MLLLQRAVLDKQSLPVACIGVGSGVWHGTLTQSCEPGQHRMNSLLLPSCGKYLRRAGAYFLEGGGRNGGSVPAQRGSAPGLTSPSMAAAQEGGSAGSRLNAHTLTTVESNEFRAVGEQA
jgi:hypothetical protein